MKVERPGTNKRRKDRLARHYELMQRFQLEGFSRENASKLALRVLSRTPEEVEQAIAAYKNEATNQCPGR